jgi:hypothetical protein
LNDIKSFFLILEPRTGRLQSFPADEALHGPGMAESSVPEEALREPPEETDPEQRMHQSRRN